jgi:hypothetical protein
MYIWGSYAPADHYPTDQEVLMRGARILGIGAALAVLGVGTALPAVAGNGTPGNTGSQNELTVSAVYGDAPYGTTPTDDAEFKATPAFIDSINADPSVSLVAHVGDIHSGKQFCTKPYDRSIADLWTAYKDPLVYTPGDNEWADCHKAGEGGNVFDAKGKPVDYANGNPVANLALVRQTFFPEPGMTLGVKKKKVVSQAQAYDPAHPSDANYVENVMWEQSGTLFVTVNIPGGSNNDADPWYGAPSTTAQTQEMTERTDADLRWLDAAFAKASADSAGSVVIITQADMWDLDGKMSSHIANYDQFIRHIAQHTSDFNKPVLLFNGDSHVYRSDNPMQENSACVTEDGSYSKPCANDAWANHPALNSLNVENFHRVTVHGSTFPLEWLKLTDDPSSSNPTTATSFGPFSWERQIQPQP